MKASRPNPRLAKIHRSYTVEEIAKLFGVHRNTVRAWISRGLPTIDQRRPLLVLGSQLAEFLNKRRAANKRTCLPGEIYCVRCREPRVPAGHSVRYQPLTPAQGNLVGLCSHCGAGLYRRVSFDKLAQVRGQLAITATDAQEHIGESLKPSENCDSKTDGRNHVKASP